jgi:preprotein translocase subunit YajC
VDSVSALLPLVLLLVFYLLIIRPARNRARAQQRLQSELSPGLEVMTTSGLRARISAVEDDVVVLEIAPGVTTRWTKAAVARVIPAADGGAPGDAAAADEQADVVDLDRPAGSASAAPSLPATDTKRSE